MKKSTLSLVTFQYRRWIPVPLRKVQSALGGLPHHQMSAALLNETDADGSVRETFLESSHPNAQMVCVYRPMLCAERVGTEVQVTVRLPIRRVLAWWAPLVKALRSLNSPASPAMQSGEGNWPRLTQMLSLH